MTNILLVNKPCGLTSLQAIRAVKQMYPELNGMKVSYAGRLDPMAEGLLILLIGTENKNRHSYENLTKTYEFDILFGITTDTYDCLGKITKITRNYSPEKIKQKLEEFLPTLIGSRQQQFPPFSSKPVNGQPLFVYARENRIHEVELPSKQITIYDIHLVNHDLWQAKDLEKNINSRIQKVDGNFRQESILNLWEEFFQNNRDRQFLITKCLVTCSSGTYVRDIAHQTGAKLGTGALAFTIKRTAINHYTLSEAIKI